MKKLNFNFENLKKKLPTIKYILLAIILIALVGAFGLAQKQQKPANQVKTPEISQATPPQQYKDFHLIIPSLNINAPIIADVDGNDKEAYFKALEGGVAHYKGTSKPGEGSNIFIFGHSSYYWWAAGDYKEIFKTLENIKTDDEIDVWYQEKEYKYKVSETKVVEPTEISVLKPTSSEQLTLMTCVPVGTADKRLIVIGKPI